MPSVDSEVDEKKRTVGVLEAGVEWVNLGIPVPLRAGGLVTPAIREADTSELPEVMARLGDLAERARRGSLRACELTEATLTMTNLCDRGAESVQGAMYPPQMALAGFGGVSDGHLGGLVLEVIDRLLTHPEVL